jgi:peroxiredoxin
MNKIILVFILLFISKNIFSQKFFPVDVKLKNISGNTFSSKSITNYGNPLILEFFGTSCKPCIKLLNSFKEVYPQWKKDYKLKIIVIVTEKTSKRKKLKKMIKKYNWPFQFYFDSNKKLFNNLTNSNVIPQSFVFDGKFKIVKKIIGVKPNYAYKIINGKISNEKVLINSGKYSNLDCDLVDYENTFNKILEKK